MSILSYTANFRFGLIDYATRTWHDDEYRNWNLLDGLLANQDTTIPFTLDIGVPNGIALTYAPAIASYYTGLRLSFSTANAEVGPTTVNVNGLGARTLKINGVDPDTGDLDANVYVSMIYDGTEFLVIQPNRRNTQSALIFTGPSGAVADTLADDFIIESNVDAGLSLLTPAGKLVSLFFGRPTIAKAGGLQYDHATDLMYLRVANTNLVTFGGAAGVASTKFTGNLVGNVTGNSVGTHTGNVVGNVAGDISGNAAGNAGTATKLITARNISTSGAVTAPGVAFDGSADIALVTTLAAGIVANANMAAMAANRVKGSVAGGVPADLTPSDILGMLGLTGVELEWTTTVCPSWALECDGTAVSRTTYARLFAVIGTNYGVGDGLTTFNLPESRGEFVRGWDHGRAVDTGRAMYTAQGDIFQGHIHNTGLNTNFAGAGIPAFEDGAGTTIVQYPSGVPLTDGVNGAPRTGAETRPRNVVRMKIIVT